jgi:hypothetical protein
MFSSLATPYSSFLYLFVSKSFFMRFVEKFQKREMHNHTYGEVFEREAPRVARPSRSTSQFRPSYNEDLISPSIGDEGDDGDAHPSSFPCTNFLRDAGILDEFLFLVNRVGFTTYMLDESDQYAMLTNTFVESFTFTNSAFTPSIAMFGAAKKIQNRPADLLELYRGVTNDDDHTAQRGKIRNIQLPAIRYFAYYLATSILGREKTSNISNYHLAFLATALNVSNKYNLGALIAHRIA